MACFLYASSMAVQPDYCWISCIRLPALSASTFAPGHQTWPYTAPAHHAAAKLEKKTQKTPQKNHTKQVIKVADAKARGLLDHMHEC